MSEREDPCDRPATVVVVVVVVSILPRLVRGTRISMPLPFGQGVEISNNITVGFGQGHKNIALGRKTFYKMSGFNTT